MGDLDENKINVKTEKSDIMSQAKYILSTGKKKKKKLKEKKSAPIVLRKKPAGFCST